MPRKPHQLRTWRFISSLPIMLLVVMSVTALIATVVSFASNSSSSATPAPVSAAQDKGQNTLQTVAARPAAREALQALQNSASGDIRTLASRETGAYSFVRADGNTLLVADDTSASPQTRALTFLSNHGALIGISDAERTALAASANNTLPALGGRLRTGAAAAPSGNLRVAKIVEGKDGDKHVRLNQFYQGLPVFGAQVVVHMNARGIYAVNGAYAPDINVNPTPRISAAAAAQAAVASLRKATRITALTVNKNELSIYRAGLLEGYYGQNVLAYGVEVSGAGTRELVFVNAHVGGVINRIALNHKALHRTIYTPDYDPDQPDLFVARREGDPALPGPPSSAGGQPINNLYDFAGHTYNLYASAFERDSYDGAGHKMASVYLVNDKCPNAYWNGIATNYCPDLDADDVVSHEWSHAYTQYTHGLIYSYQSGALNESYSDIFGETVDLLNGVDGEGGSNNAEPLPNGQRWQVGDDVPSLNQEALGILRDMWTPTRYLNADRVGNTEFYHCAASDGGGVHANSGVPNHAFAMLVDGKTFNNVVVQGIGLTKALHIYWRAASVYQTPSTNFANHEESLIQSCTDLKGVNLNKLKTDSTTPEASGEIINDNDCQQVANAMQAVEMSDPPPCDFSPLLEPGTPETCAGVNDIFTENWESGMGGWTTTTTGVTPDWDNRNWTLDSTLPAGHSGTAAFGKNPPLGGPDGGTCQPGGDFSGQFTIDSPAITVPAGVTAMQMIFDHYVATEATFDGGQVEISKNGGAYTLLPQGNYIFNPPNSQLDSAPPVGLNTNPNAGEFAWNGTNTGTQGGSWGTTLVNLGTVAPGDTIKVRFNFSQDGCNGVDGWYVDNIRVFSCPTLSAPVLSLGTDYENPDTNGSYTLNWTRPAGASGPEKLEESTTSCGPLLSDNAENGTSQWTTAQQGAVDSVPPLWQSAPANAKPGHNSATFWAHGVEQESQNTSTTLTFNNAIQIPTSGNTYLNFSEWYFNEDDDRGLVEVSEDNGATWTAVYTNARSQGDLPDVGAAAFAEEQLVRQQIDLTIYSGKSIRLRFKYALGNSNVILWTQYGWYIDDISITSDNWSNLISTSGTSHTVSGRSNGTRCYRVSSIYTLGSQQVQSPFSNIVQAVVSGNLVCSIPLALRIPPADFDGDGKTDVSVFTSSSGNWTIINSNDGTRRVQSGWGTPTDIAVPGDYDGDRKADIAVFRPDEGNWYIIRSSGGTEVRGWGNNGDKPVPADYDGDGRTDIAVFRPHEGNWYVKLSTGGSTVKGWGLSTDKPVPGDYDRDGKADVAVFRPDEGNWYIINSSDNSLRTQQWGFGGDRPVQGDYDGDGKTDPAIYRESEGTWHITASCALASGRVKQWGIPGDDVPAPGDYDGDGKTDIAVFRPSEGNWYILLSATSTHVQPSLGGGGDIPTPTTYIP